MGSQSRRIMRSKPARTIYQELISKTKRNLGQLPVCSRSIRSAHVSFNSRFPLRDFVDLDFIAVFCTPWLALCLPSLGVGVELASLFFCHIFHFINGFFLHPCIPNQMRVLHPVSMLIEPAGQQTRPCQRRTLFIVWISLFWFSFT